MGLLRRPIWTPGANRELTRCLRCGSDCSVPVEWHEHDATHWWIRARCGECEAFRELILTDAQAKRYDAALDRGTHEIAGTLSRIEMTRMAAEAETFAKALELDLFDASDFAA